MIGLKVKLEREVRALCLLAIQGGGEQADRARPILRALNFRPQPKQVPGAEHMEQLVLWDASTGVPWRMDPAKDHVACSHFHVTCMPLSTCLERQAGRWPGRNKLGDGSTRRKKASVYEYCGSGVCQEGLVYLRSAPPEWKPKLASNPGRIFYRQDSHDQHQARRRFIREHADEVPDLDHPPGGLDRPPPLDLADPDVQHLLDGG